MQKEINKLIDQLPNKSEFGRELAEKFNIQYTSIKQNWIYGQSIPEHYQEEVKEMLNKKLGIFEEGQKVTYVTPYKREKGIIKGLMPSGKGAFVVYHCNNDWENYKDYTGAGTDFKDLEIGWEPENENQ